MSAKKETLELNCKIMNFSLFYKTKQALWDDQNAKLFIEEEDDKQVGCLKVWKENVKPELIKENRLLLEEKVESFALGMQFIGNRRLTWSQTELFYYIDDEERFHIRSDIDIEAVIRRLKGEEFNYLYGELPGPRCDIKVKTSPISLPVKMPAVPLTLRRHILTIRQAEELDEYSGNYQDEKLKRWFLILEELEVNKNLASFKDIKYVRHFVSHSVCHGPEVLDFLKRELPNAVYINSNVKEEARFLRDDQSHISLVSKFEIKACDWASNLVKQEIIKNGGCV